MGPGRHVEPIDHGSDADRVNSQRLAAGEFHSCLEEADLPAEVMPLNDSEPDGAMVVVWAPDHEVIDSGPNGGIQGSAPEVARPDGGREPSASADDAETAPSEGYLLVIDGVDYGDVYEACLADSDYSPPRHAEDFDLAQDLRIEQAVADVTNKWIACARGNGCPNLDDVRASGTDSSFPSVELPWETNEQELSALLARCPVATDEADGEDSGVKVPAGFVAGVELSIETPESAMAESWGPDLPDYQRWQEMTAIIEEAK
jgi:hypothetical protein